MTKVQLKNGDVIDVASPKTVITLKAQGATVLPEKAAKPATKPAAKTVEQEAAK